MSVLVEWPLSRINCTLDFLFVNGTNSDNLSIIVTFVHFLRYFIYAEGDSFGVSIFIPIAVLSKPSSLSICCSSPDTLSKTILLANPKLFKYSLFTCIPDFSHSSFLEEGCRHFCRDSISLPHSLPEPLRLYKIILALATAHLVTLPLFWRLTKFPEEFVIQKKGQQFKSISFIDLLEKQVSSVVLASHCNPL